MTKRIIIRYNQRDKDFLKALYYARYMRTDQIVKLFWMDWTGETEQNLQTRFKACNRRLRKFTKARILRRFKTPVDIQEQITLGLGSDPYIYAPDVNAKPILGKMDVSIRDRDFEQKSYEKRNTGHLYHLLGAVDVHTAVHQDSFGHPYIEPVGWVDDRYFQQNPFSVTMTDPTGKTSKTLQLIPDAHLPFTDHGKLAMPFLELDLKSLTIEPSGSELTGWINKMKKYFHWYGKEVTQDENGNWITQYQKRFNTKSLHILVVTTSDIRAQHLREATESIKDKSVPRVRFTTTDKVKQFNFYTYPIWTVAGHADKGLQALVKAQEVEQEEQHQATQPEALGLGALK